MGRIPGGGVVNELNELHAAELDEIRSTRHAMTEMGRAAGCGYPIQPCGCGTCDTTGEW